MDTPDVATDRLDLPPLTPDALQALIDADPFFRDRLRDHPEEAAWWARLLVRRDTGAAVGWAGFTGPPDETGTVTVGYAVYPACRGHGFATEAVRGLVLWALAQPGVARVRATIPPGDAPSRRVAERAGLRPVGTDHDDEAGEVQVWAIEAPA